MHAQYPALNPEATAILLATYPCDAPCTLIFRTNPCPVPAESDKDETRDLHVITQF